MKSALVLLLCLVTTMASPYWLDSPMIRQLTSPNQKKVDPASILACNCEYHWGGCRIERGSIPGYKCVCSYQGGWTGRTCFG